MQAVLSPRRQIAHQLARIYTELAGTEEKPAPQFSVARVIGQMAAGGLRSGYEHEIASGAAFAADRPYDPYRVKIPWAALASRDLDETTGGPLVFTKVAPAVDALRPWSVSLQAGVTVFPNLRENISVPRVEGDVTGEWLASEISAVTPADPTLESVAMSIHTWSGIVEYSHQFVRQTDQAEPFIRQQLRRVAGRALDAAILGGSGASGEPLGIANISTITTESGATFALATALAMREDVGSANDLKLSWIAPPAVRKVLAARQTVSGGSNMIWQDNMIDGRPAYTTPDAPAGVLFLADWSTVAVGLWGPGITLEINPYQDFARGIIAARVLLDCDVAVLQKDAIALATSVS